MSGGIDDGYSDGLTIANTEGPKVIGVGLAAPEGDRSEKMVIIGDGRDHAARIMAITQIMAAGMALGTISSSPRMPGLNTFRKKYKPCDLPGCNKHTDHRGGYCSPEHCREHRVLLKGQRRNRDENIKIQLQRQ